MRKRTSIILISAPWNLDEDDQTKASISIGDDAFSHLNSSLGSILAPSLAPCDRTLTLMANSQTLHPTCRNSICNPVPASALHIETKTQSKVENQNLVPSEEGAFCPVEFTFKGRGSFD